MISTVFTYLTDVITSTCENPVQRIEAEECAGHPGQWGCLVEQSPAGGRFLHIAGRPCSLGQRGRDAPAANEAEGFLDLLVSESIYNRVDDGIVGGGQEGGIGIDGGVGVIRDQGVQSERHPTRSKGPQDESQG